MLYQAVGREPSFEGLERALGKLGVEVLDYQDWPGFDRNDFAVQDEFSEKLKELMQRHRQPDPVTDESFERRLEERFHLKRRLRLS